MKVTKKNKIVMTSITVILIISVLCLIKPIEYLSGIDIMKNLTSKKETKKDEKQTKNANDLKNDINKIIDEACNGKNIGVAFTDLATNTYIGKNDNKKFEADNTINLPIALYMSKSFDNQWFSKEHTIAYTQSDYDEGAGVIKNDQTGTRYSLEDLVKNMIIHSDNIAYNMILKFVGRTDLQDGLTNIINDTIVLKNNMITPKQMNSFLKVLYDKRETDNYKQLVDELKQTTANDKFTKEVNKDNVAHMASIDKPYSNDVGIFFERQPYLLSVYSKDVDSDLVSKLSKKINDYYKSVNIQ